MIKCICVDDSNKPSKIPDHKWIKKGQEYHVIFALYTMPQNKLAVQLNEILLDESCAPYEYFRADRFNFRSEDLYRIMDMVRLSSQLNKQINENTERYTSVCD